MPGCPIALRAPTAGPCTGAARARRVPAASLPVSGSTCPGPSCRCQRVLARESGRQVACRGRSHLPASALVGGRWRSSSRSRGGPHHAADRPPRAYADRARAAAGPGPSGARGSRLRDGAAVGRRDDRAARLRAFRRRPGPDPAAHRRSGPGRHPRLGRARRTGRPDAGPGGADGRRPRARRGPDHVCDGRAVPAVPPAVQRGRAGRADGVLGRRGPAGARPPDERHLGPPSALDRPGRGRRQSHGRRCSRAAAGIAAAADERHLRRTGRGGRPRRVRARRPRRPALVARPVRRDRRVRGRVHDVRPPHRAAGDAADPVRLQRAPVVGRAAGPARGGSRRARDGAGRARPVRSGGHRRPVVPERLADRHRAPRAAGAGVPGRRGQPVDDPCPPAASRRARRVRHLVRRMADARAATRRASPAARPGRLRGPERPGRSRRGGRARASRPPCSPRSSPAGCSDGRPGRSG